MSDIDGLADHNLLASIAGIAPGDHVCVLYDYSPVERLPEVIAYLKEGLDAGERSVFVSDELSLQALTPWFRTYGVDIDEARASGKLLLWSRHEWRQPGPLDAIYKAAHVKSIVEAAFEQGLAGVRFAVDMTWTLDPEIPAEQLEAWEAHSNLLLTPGAPVRAMCLYGRRRLSKDAIEAGLTTHPKLLDDSGLSQNERYETT